MRASPSLEEIESFSHKQLLALALACCERMYPNYVCFSFNCKWGDVESLRSSLDTVWRYLMGDDVISDCIEDLSEQCKKAIPDTEEYGSVLGSLALDASTSVYLLLQLVKARRMETVLEILGLSLDSIYLYTYDKVFGYRKK